ncbi:hypothetical protein V6N13_098752 [Hibiscus sabdariffa]
MFDLAINTTLDPKTLIYLPKNSSLLLGVGADFPIPGKGCFAIFGLFGKEFPNLFALKFIRVNYVEVETIFSWRLRIQERKEYVIEEAIPNDPGPNASRADKDKFKKHMDDMVDVGCLMLATMTPELQKQHENMVAYEMIQNLKEIYEGQARQERYETSKALFQCKMSEGSPMGAHVIKMMGYIQTLEKLGFALNDELAVDVVLQSLPDSFNQFVLNFNMNEINKTLPQLLGMLRTAESNM